MKKYIVLAVSILLIVIVALVIFIKPKGNLKLETKDLVSIQVIDIENNETKHMVSSNQFDEFIKDLNSKVYKGNQKNYKAKGSYKVILTYSDQTITLDRYRTEINDKVYRRLYESDFDNMLKAYCK